MDRPVALSRSRCREASDGLISNIRNVIMPFYAPLQDMCSIACGTLAYVFTLSAIRTSVRLAVNQHAVLAGKSSAVLSFWTNTKVEITAHV